MYKLNRIFQIFISAIPLSLLGFITTAQANVLKANVSQNSIYVSPQGNNRNEGSQEKPFATLKKALKEAKPGQTIYLREGRYFGNEKISNIAATKSKPITIQAFPNETVIFDGTVGINQIAGKQSLESLKSGGTGWLKHSSNIYKMQLQHDIWQLFIMTSKGAEQMVPARWPNAKFSDGSIYQRSSWATARNALKTEPGISTNPIMNKINTGISNKDVINNCFKDDIDLTNLSQLQKLDPKYCYGVSVDALPTHKRVLTPAQQKKIAKRPWLKLNNNADQYGHDLASETFDATGSMAILNYGHWRTWTRPVVSHKGGTFTHLATPHLYGTGHYYYLEGALSLLDQPEEWYYDQQTKTVYLWAPNNEALNEQTINVRAKVQANAFNMFNADHVTFKNLSFFATAFTCFQCDNMLFDNLTMEYAGSSKRMLKEWATVATNKKGVTYLSDATPDIVNIEGKYTLKSAKKSNSVISNSIFKNIDGPALQFHGNGNKIINNRFENIDYTASEGWPFQAAINTFKGKDTTFSYNTFYNTGLSQMYRAHSGDITHNYVDKIGWAQSDGAVLGANSTGLAVAYNWTFSDHDKGIRIDAPFPPKHVNQWNTDNYIHHNVTMYNRGIVAKGWKHRIYNNTILEIPYIDPFTGQADPIEPRLVLNNDVQLLARHNVTEQQLGCKVGINCGANLETISANNLSPYILAGLGSRIERKTPILAVQHHDFETSKQGNTSVSSLLRDPLGYDFRAKPSSDIAHSGVSLQTFSKTEQYADYQGLPQKVDYIGAYASNAKHYNIPGQRQVLASFPIPLNGSNSVKINSDLMWREALHAEKYQVYFAKNIQQLNAATTPAAEFFAEQQVEQQLTAGLSRANNIFTPNDLVAGQAYVWRVDVVSKGKLFTGNVWQFTVER